MRNPKRPSGRSQGLWCAQWWSNISGRRRERTVVEGGREGGRERTVGGEREGGREEGREGGTHLNTYILISHVQFSKNTHNDRDG